jgi:phosphatidate phosphatase PAH1
MRNLIIFLMVMLGSSCAQQPANIPSAPQDHAQAVVFDIDGTLTPTPLEFWEARKDAAKAVQTFADKGYKIIYLSARVTLLQANIPDWLKKNSFPDGGVYVTETTKDQTDHAQFKTRILRELLAHGWKVEFAYGDSSTDFEAYGAVGIPKERVFALKREGDTSCQPGTWNACLSGWTEHIDSIMKQTQSMAAS